MARAVANEYVRRYLRWHSRHDSCATAGDDDGYDDEKVTVLVRMQFVISPDIQQKVPCWLLHQSDAVARYSMRGSYSPLHASFFSIVEMTSGDTYILVS